MYRTKFKVKHSKIPVDSRDYKKNIAKKNRDKAKEFFFQILTYILAPCKLSGHLL